MGSKSTVFIYALKDPRTDAIHYIGKSAEPAKRLRQHLDDRTTNYAKMVWLDELRKESLRPQLVILEKVDTPSWPEAERRWIERGRKNGWSLVNIKGGGEGARITSVSDFQFFHVYLSMVNRSLFDGLSFEVQCEICRLTAVAMFEYRLEAIRKRKIGYVVDWNWVGEQEWAEGLRTASHAMEEFANPSDQ